MKVKDLKTDLDLIIALENIDVIVEDYDDWQRVKDLANDFSCSQGFYSRLLRDMLEFEENYELTYPITI